jgi:hypothetical protein
VVPAALAAGLLWPLIACCRLSARCAPAPADCGAAALLRPCGRELRPGQAADAAPAFSSALPRWRPSSRRSRRSCCASTACTAGTATPERRAPPAAWLLPTAAGPAALPSSLSAAAGAQRPALGLPGQQQPAAGSRRAKRGAALQGCLSCTLHATWLFKSKDGRIGHLLGAAGRAVRHIARAACWGASRHATWEGRRLGGLVARRGGPLRLPCQRCFLP